LLGRGFDDIPEAPESVGDQEGVTGLEGLRAPVLGNQPHMARNDKAEFVAVSEGAPFAGRAGPCAGGQLAVGTFKTRRDLVVRISLHHPVRQIAKTTLRRAQRFV